MAKAEIILGGGGSSNEFYGEYTTAQLPADNFINCGFKPTTICMETQWNNGTLTYASIYHNGTARRVFNGNIDTDSLVDSITDTGFYIKSASKAYMTFTAIYATDI